jgi:hypothetical protein
LNRRIDSFRPGGIRMAPHHVTFFFSAMARKPKLRGIFQLPFAAFLLRACGCGNFFEQKIQLAGAEQIEG